MEYADFYDIAVYLNGINRNVFTQREVACYAYDYLCEFNASQEKGKPTHTIEELMKLLAEDEECKYWLNLVKTELGFWDEDEDADWDALERELIEGTHPFLEPWDI